MPTYVYRCGECETEEEVRHGIKSSYDAPCSGCGSGDLSRVIFPPRDVFVRSTRDNATPSNRSITTGQKSGAPGIRVGFREGYKGALARYPGDPKAYVSSKRDAMKRANEMGIADQIRFSADDVAPE